MATASQLNGIQGFLYSHVFIKKTIIDPDDGETMTVNKKIARNLPDIQDTAWQEPEMIFHAIKPALGKPFEVGKNGTSARNIYLNGVQGPEREDGKRFSALLIGRLYSKTTQDVETGEMKTVHWVQIFSGFSKSEPTKSENCQTEEVSQNNTLSDSAEKTLQDAPGTSVDDKVALRGLETL